MHLNEKNDSKIFLSLKKIVKLKKKSPDSSKNFDNSLRQEQTLLLIIQHSSQRVSFSFKKSKFSSFSSNHEF